MVVNSVAGCVSAEQEGYPVNKLKVIHNGVDMQRFVFDGREGKKWRASMKIPPGARLIGMAGRLDPAKNYEVFLMACEIVASQDDSVYFAIVGGGDNDYAMALKEKIVHHPLFEHRLFYKPNETRMTAMYSALDVMTLTSKSEGLPNTVVEAMACGKRCVVTDVGDCRLAVDRFGVVCEVGDVKGIANGWLTIGLAEGKEEGVSKNTAELRAYMEQTFSLEKMTRQFESVCADILEDGRPGG